MRRKQGESPLEVELAGQLKMLGVLNPETQYRFHPKRKWTFDFAWPEFRLAVEVEGGSWVGGRHSRGAGFERDCEKYNEAALMGYRVLRFTGAMIKSWAASRVIRRALGME